MLLFRLIKKHSYKNRAKSLTSIKQLGYELGISIARVNA